MQIFNFRFWMDLYFLGCPEQDLIISGKCLCAVCVWQKCCGKCSSRTNEHNFMTLYILYHLNKKKCLSTFGGNRSTDGAAIKRFPDFLGCADLSFYLMKSHKNLYTRYRLLERKIVQFLYICVTKGRSNPVFFQNSSDSNISACIKWNCTKFFTQDTCY